MRCERLLFGALALALVTTPASAKPRLGLVAGFNVANLDIDGRSGLGARTTFAFGGAVDVPISERFGVRVDPMFLSKGGKATKQNAYWGVFNAEFDLDYIEVPVMARFDLATTETRGYLLGGFGLGFAASREAELSGNGRTEKVDFGDVFSSTDVSLDLGAGIGIPAGTGRVTFDGRAALGLTDINQGGTVTFAGAPLDVPSTATHTLDFRFLATYFFP
jgi:hypothetical protein